MLIAGGEGEREKGKLIFVTVLIHSWGECVHSAQCSIKKTNQMPSLCVRAITRRRIVTLLDGVEMFEINH